MLDQLIESTTHASENKRRGGYILTTLTLIFTLFSSGLLWSMFAKDLGIGDESLELSELVAPVAPPETVPPPRPEMPKQASPQTRKSASDVPMRTENVQRIDEVPVKPPSSVLTDRSTSVSRPPGPVVFGDRNSDPIDSGNTGRNPGGEPNGTGIAKPDIPAKLEPEDIDPPKPKKPEVKPEVEAAPVKPITRSEGVINGKATYLPRPPYSAAAKAIKASGQVTVQVTVDENGNVTSVKAVKGHPIFLRDCENAARQAKFSPTFLGKTPVKVTGMIIYNFVP